MLIKFKNMNEKVTYEDFKKLDIRIGKIIEAENVPKSRALVKLMVDIGEDKLRQIVAGISQYYKPKELINRKILVLTNLQPRKLMGLESQGMLLAADVEHQPFLLKLPDYAEDDIPPGTKIS